MASAPRNSSLAHSVKSCLVTIDSRHASPSGVGTLERTGCQQLRRPTVSDLWTMPFGWFLNREGESGCLRGQEWEVRVCFVPIVPWTRCVELDLGTPSPRCSLMCCHITLDCLCCHITPDLLETLISRERQIRVLQTIELQRSPRLSSRKIREKERPFRPLFSFLTTQVSATSCRSGCKKKSTIYSPNIFPSRSRSGTSNISLR